jgi:glycosyltransferase involved in cell wall biosynthesis
VKFSVIIATHNEGPQIAQYLRRLREISGESPLELILVDGGSDDDTVAAARDWVDEILVQAAPNRGAQLDEGAMKATGDLLFFLRPDSQLPVQWQQALEHYWLSQGKGLAATVFTVDYGHGFRLVSWWTNLTARLRGLPSGEQGFCTTPEIYKKSGGIPHYPGMDDVGFAQRLRKTGHIAILPGVIRPAGRRLRRLGTFRFCLDEFWRSLRYSLGFAPEKITD